MKNFPLTTKNRINENIALDMNSFIEKKTGLNVGWEEDEDIINFVTHYPIKFDIYIDTNNTLKEIQRQVHNCCRKWNNKNKGK